MTSVSMRPQMADLLGRLYGQLMKTMSLILAGNNETVDLSTYTGTVQFAFYASSTGGSADNDVS